MCKRITTSGQAVKEVKPYRFESQLHFLLEYMEERETKRNIERRPDIEYAEFDNDDEGHEFLQTTDIPCPPKVSKQPVRPSFTYSPSSSAVTFAKPSRKKIFNLRQQLLHSRSTYLKKRNKRENQALMDYTS